MVGMSINKLLRSITPRWLHSGALSSGDEVLSTRQEAIHNAIMLGSLACWLDDVQEQVPADFFTKFARSARDMLRPIVDQGRQGAFPGAMNYAAAQVLEMFSELPGAEEMYNYMLEKAAHVSVASGMDYRQELFNQVVRLHLLLRRLSCKSSREIMKLQCPYLASGEASAPPGNKSGFVELTVLFVTNRKPSGQSDPRAFFSTARCKDLTYGCAMVSMPDVLGLKDKLPDPPCTWSFQTKRAVGKRNRKVVISKLFTGTQTCSANAIRRISSKTDGKEALVFVHGYNTRFRQAVKHLAAAAYTMAWDGPIILFSWPSFESLQWYTGDEANAMWSVTHFEEQLRFWTSPACGLKRLDFLAHSMGSRVLIYGLTRFDPGKQPEGAAKLGRVVLAAPDFDTWEFHLMAEALAKKVEHVTIYCASDDQALKMSTTIHGGYPRLGDFRWSTSLDTKERPLLLCSKIDIIDATGLDSSLLGPHHGYIFSQTVVVLDLFEHLRSGSLALERPNIEARQTSFGRNYFVLVPPEKVEEQVLLRLSSSSSSSSSSEPPSPQSVMEGPEEWDSEWQDPSLHTVIGEASPVVE